MSARRMLARGAAAAASLLLAAGGGAALAQSSANHRLTESVFNTGGRPLNGAVASSTSHRVRLDAIGESAIGVSLSSASWRVDAGFVDVYRPPGEAKGLRFTDRTTLGWDPEPTVGRYNLYRDAVGTLPGNYGSCFRSSIAGESWTDAAQPPSGNGWFYLVTAENRLEEEGTKGVRSSGVERANPAPCP
jgi:hypothetical protein